MDGLGKKGKQPDAEQAWRMLRLEVAEDARREPALAQFLQRSVLSHATLEDSLSVLLSSRLASASVPADLLRTAFDAAMTDDPAIGAAVRADLRAIYARDPALAKGSTPLLYFKGFHALEAWRVSHWLWNEGRRALALHLQSRISEVFAASIAPAARIGSGVFIDHGTGVIIGETAVVGDNVEMLHNVTLGSTGRDTGDRHPKIEDGVYIGAGTKVLGNIRVGAGARIGASSLVLEDLPAGCTAVGVPARVVRQRSITPPSHPPG